jgi:predicted DsbA family dithiol-disulfide isomerase
MSQTPAIEPATATPAALRIDIFADVACPWCYIGERRLTQALAARPDLHVERHWRPYQLQPDLPRGGISWSDLVDQKFGGAERAAAMFGRVAAAGAADGLQFNFDRAWAMVETLFAAYFTNGRDVSDRSELVRLAAKAGFDADSVRDYLASDANAAAVQASQRTAHQYGVQGVPFFVFAERYALSGAQPLEIFERALDLASTADGDDEG